VTRTGDVYETVLVRDLSRTQLVQYAGASGDYNPLHTDEDHAIRLAGEPSVFAHGMLTMGLAARLVTDQFPPAAVTHFGGRFTARVWPGDTLTGTATVGAVEGSKVRTVALELEVANQDGIRVFAGSAVIRRTEENCER
jgi:acyl dehydratase